VPKQQTLNFNAPVRKVVNCDTYNEPEQSRGETLRARITSNELKEIDSFCRGRRINRSEYVRHLLSLDSRYFDLIEKLNQYGDDFVISMLDNLPKKF
jgi:hypothetical protein